MPAKANTASAFAEAATTADTTTALLGVSYRILPRGAGLIYTGDYDPVTGASLTFGRGEVVEGAEAAIAAELEDRGLVEVLGQA